MNFTPEFLHPGLFVEETGAGPPLDLEFEINDETPDRLNSKGVNAIRCFPGSGIPVWGARRLSTDPEWKYIGARVRDTIRPFLREQWRSGALSGATEEKALFVTCDETTMAQDDILNGRLICKTGIAPIRPAEFVIFRIFQHTAAAKTRAC